MAASINPHYHGLVDMGRYVGLKKTIFVESHILNADYHNGGGCLFCGPVRMRSEPEDRLGCLTNSELIRI